MSELAQATFRITFDVTVRVRDIDDQLVEQHLSRIGNGDEVARWPETPEMVARDRRLLHAILAHPEHLLSLLRRRALESTETIDCEDTSLDTLQTQQLTNSALVEAMRDALSLDDYHYYRDACEEGYFDDSSDYYYAAVATEQARFQIEDLTGIEQ
jgi:hypothetical protein